MTGRGAGFCGGAGMPGFMNWMYGAFLGRGRGGGGRGWRNMFYASGLPGWVRAGAGVAGAAMAASAFRGMTREQELDTLKQQADQAAAVLESIRQRISELEADARG
jgi:hypothetical protein